MVEENSPTTSLNSRLSPSHGSHDGASSGGLQPHDTTTRGWSTHEYYLLLGTRGSGWRPESKSGVWSNPSLRPGRIIIINGSPKSLPDKG